MRSHFSHHPLRFLVLVLALASCDSSTPAALPPPTGAFPLIPGTWYMHSANDSTLPATISARTVGVAQESSLLDSSRLTISSDGSYQQRYWYRVFVGTTLDRSEVVHDEGLWVLTGSEYRLISSLRARTSTLTVPQLGRVITDEQMVFYSSAPRTTGVYRLSRP